jgi:hypothetical protein
MIRVDVTDEQLFEAIEAERPGWLERAKAKTRECVAKAHVDDGDAIWSEVKQVFARLQNFKCIYCERALPEKDNSTGQGAAQYDESPQG